VTANSLRELVSKMNAVPDVEPLDYDLVEVEVTAATVRWSTSSPKTVR